MAPYQTLLQSGKRRIADLNGQITTRDHNDVTGCDDLVDILHGLGALNLCDDVSVAVSCTQQLACLPNIFSLAGK